MHEQRKADGVKSAADEVTRLRRYAFPSLGRVLVTKLTTGQVNAALDDTKRAAKGLETCKHVKGAIAAVFASLRREGVVQRSPVDGAELPKFPEVAPKQRAVLTDSELARYLGCSTPSDATGWQP